MEIEAKAQGKAWEVVKALRTKVMDKVMSIGRTAKKVGKDDPRKVVHSLKVGLALTLVSLLYYAKPLYDGFGVAGMWAVLTVVVVFEFTVGGTLSKSINRGVATILAGGLGIGSQYFASLFGERGEPIVLGILVFILAAGATFSRFIPGIKARYDYGVLIFILTFSLVAVSGYRVEELVALAHQRVSTIVIGGATCMVISIFVCPVWAGEDLHNLVASNLDKLANYLQEFGGVYFEGSTEDGGGAGSKDGKSSQLLQGCKSVLNSKATEESLANLARWEPLHGRFRLRHPWKLYLKIGALARQCACRIEAINAHLHSNSQATEEFKREIEEPCRRMSKACGKALETLATAIKTMSDPSSARLHIQETKSATEGLKINLRSKSFDGTDLLSIVPAATIASILIDIAGSVEEISKCIHQLSTLARFQTLEPTVSQEKPLQLLHRGMVNPVVEGERDDVVVVINAIPSDSPENDEAKEAKTNQLGNVGLV